MISVVRFLHDVMMSSPELIRRSAFALSAVSVYAAGRRKALKWCGSRRGGEAPRLARRSLAA